MFRKPYELRVQRINRTWFYDKCMAQDRAAKEKCEKEEIDKIVRDISAAGKQQGETKND